MLFLINRRLGRCRWWVTWVVDGVGERIPAVLIIYMSHGGCLSSLGAVGFDEDRKRPNAVQRIWVSCDCKLVRTENAFSTPGHHVLITGSRC